MTAADVIALYQDLLIQQYHALPRARATISALAGEAVADLIVQAVLDGFGLDTALGPQVDALGEYRGVARKIFGLNLNRNFLAFPSVVDANIATVKGFSTSTNPTPPDWFFLTDADLNALTYALKDDEMIRLIQFRAAVHGAHLGLGEVDQILYSFFGTAVTLTDNHDMTILYTNAGTDTLFATAKATNSLPRTAGVSLSATP